MRRHTTRFLVGLFACNLWLAAPAARAQTELKDDPQARQFFEVGAQAYAKGQYLLAIDAFKEAYKLTERPGILFSIAQAHQRQFRAKGEEQHLSAAIEHFRRYLARVPNGGRHDEAAASLDSLLKQAERLHPQNQTPERARLFGKLLLSSPTPNAKLSVNAEPVESLPTALELPADKYHVEGSAAGYETVSQDVLITAGSSVPLNLELRPLPARVRISGPAGAEAFVDGRSVGWLPLTELVLPAGDHWISLRKTGQETKSVLVHAQRGQTARVELQLQRTGQRQAAYVTGAGALLGLAITLPLSVLAVARDREASDLDEQRRQRSLTESEGQQLNDALDARNELRTGATIAGLTTAGLLGAALVLYLTDSPAPPTAGTQQAKNSAPTRVRLVPLLGSGWAGLSAGANF